MIDNASYKILKYSKIYSRLTSQTGRFYSFIYLSRYFFLICLLFLIQFGCSIFLPAQTVLAAGSSADIQITGASNPPGFLPALLTVHVNEPVTFINYDPSSVTHTIIASDGSFTSSPIAPGKEWTVVFTKEGAHEYRDSVATQSMVGDILVIPASVSLLPTASDSAQATAVAAIKSGKNPPPVSSLPSATSRSSNNTFIISIIGIATIVFILLCIGVFLFYRSRSSSSTP